MGPFTTIAAFAVAIAATVLGRTRTRAAGIMLVAIGLTPVLSWTLVSSTDVGVASAYLIVGSPMVVTGILFLLSDLVARPGTPPGARAPRTPPLGHAT